MAGQLGVFQPICSNVCDLKPFRPIFRVNSATPSGLCLGHSGHEIRVLAWAAQHRPVVTILTDGSGPDRPSRLDSTRKVLEPIGCRVGSLFQIGKGHNQHLITYREHPLPIAEGLWDWACQGGPTESCVS